METVLVYLMIGAIAGSLSGVLGVGGGLIIVPALMWVYRKQGLPDDAVMHLAAGTSLAAMIVSSTFSLRNHILSGIDVWPIFRRLGVTVAIGTFLGSLVTHFMHSHILAVLFGLFLLVIALLMLFGKPPQPQRQLPSFFGMQCAGMLIGLKSGLFGLGGGALIIPFLTYCNVSIRIALAISIACSLTIAIIGTLGFILIGQQHPELPAWSTGYVYWPAVLGIAAVSPIFARLGTRLSHQLPVTTLKKLFGIFLLIVAVQMLTHF